MTALVTGDYAAVIEHLDWLRSRGRSDNTLEDRMGLLVRLASWLAELDEPRTLITATADDLAAWQRSISRMATGSIAAYVSHARGFYDWLERFRHLPNAGELLDRPRPPKRLPRPIDDQALIEAFQMADGRELQILCLMTFSGARCCEVAAAERPHLRDRDPKPTMTLYGKGRKHRIVPVPRDLGVTLDRLGVPPRGRMIRSATGGPVSANRVSQLMNAFLHGIGIPDTAHSVRHWYATNIYRVTRDIRLVQEIMGHESLSTTALYTAYDPANADVMTDAMGQKLVNLMGGGGDGRRLRLVD